MNGRNAAEEGEIFRLTLRGLNGEEEVLWLDEKQLALIEFKRTRSFFIRCKKERVIQAIEEAKDCAELEGVAKKYDLCDTCCFQDINFYGVKRILKVIIEALYKYPKLRSKISFLGTHDALDRLLGKMEEGDTNTLRAFDLQYICTQDNTRKLGRMIRNILKDIMARSDNYVATAMCAFGLLDAVLLDKNDYDGYAYVEFVAKLRMDERTGFHPKGCHSPESIVFHELGHLLDNMCGFSENEEFKSYYESLLEDEIRAGLSEYALTSPRECIAEAFAEYMCNTKPREISLRIGRLLDRAYDMS